MARTTRHILVDGMLSGTGIRDRTEGGYIEPEELGLPEQLCAKIAQWQNKYEALHFANYSNSEQVQRLDKEGYDLVKEIRKCLPDVEVSYFSNAKMVEHLVS